jgi:limonene-1,2-epoxide hydrolase
MADAASVVSAFVKEFDAPKPDLERLVGYFAEDAVYHNIPVDPVHGREGIRAALASFVTRMESGGWEVRNQVAAGDLVMNERVDRFRLGEKQIALPVAGVFRVADGKIAEWRDYFDMGTWQKQMA